MKYPISPETKLQAIPADADALHLVRPVRLETLKRLIARGTLRRVTMSGSCAARLGAKVKKLLHESGIEVRTERHAGRALGLELGRIGDIADMHHDDMTYREIEEKTGIPKSTAHYLVKYAAREKVKRGGTTVYFEG